LSAPLLLENRHTGERLTIRRVHSGDREGFHLHGTLPAHREGPPLHILRHRRTQTVLVMPRPVQAILFRLAVLVGTILGRYRGNDWTGCTGVPAA
jgi:hypothetical protein